RQCVQIAGEVLGKVDGASEVNADRSKQTVTFTAKDSTAATAGVKALYDAGYFGPATEDGKELKVEVASPRAGEKADEVTVKSVHLCCTQCKQAIGALFPDATVDFPDKNTVKISGKGLEKAKVLKTLREGGFNGTLDK